MSNINFFWSELRMSLGKQKNLIILGAVATALLVAGVLVADYADVLPGRAKADEQVKTCGAGEAKPCCPATTEAAGTPQVVAATEAAGFPQVVAATEAAPAKACNAADKPAGECAKQAAGCEKPAGCDKPVGGCGDPAAGCEKPMGCCGEAPKDCCEKVKPAEALGSCPAAKADAAAE